VVNPIGITEEIRAERRMTFVKPVALSVLLTSVDLVLDHEA
jgi:hypothetical protein